MKSKDPKLGIIFDSVFSPEPHRQVTSNFCWFILHNSYKIPYSSLSMQLNVSQDPHHLISCLLQCLTFQSWERWSCSRKSILNAVCKEYFHSSLYVFLLIFFFYLIKYTLFFFINRYPNGQYSHYLPSPVVFYESQSTCLHHSRYNLQQAISGLLSYCLSWLEGSLLKAP